MSNTKEEGRAWFALLAGIPALLAWVAYGAAWLLAPRFPELPDPILCAGYAAGGWYALVILFTAGPVIFLAT